MAGAAPLLTASLRRDGDRADALVPYAVGGAAGGSGPPFRPFWRLLQAAVGRKVLQKLLQNAAEVPGQI